MFKMWRTIRSADSRAFSWDGVNLTLLWRSMLWGEKVISVTRMDRVTSGWRLWLKLTYTTTCSYIIIVLMMIVVSLGATAKTTSKRESATDFSVYCSSCGAVVRLSDGHAIHVRWNSTPCERYSEFGGGGWEKVDEPKTWEKYSLFLSHIFHNKVKEFSRRDN